MTDPGDWNQSLDPDRIVHGRPAIGDNAPDGSTVAPPAKDVRLNHCRETHMHPLLRSAAFSLCLFALVVPTAFAEDSAELERIRRAIADAIEPDADPAALKVILAEPVGATWRDKCAVVTLKGAKLSASDGVNFAIGDIEIAVLPRDEGLYDFDVTMPKNFEVLGADGVSQGNLGVANYKLAGTWSREVASLVKLDAALEKVQAKSIKDGIEDFTASLASLDAQMDYTRGSGGLWSGTAKARLSDLKILAEGGEDVKISAIDLESSTKGSDWEAWRRIMEKIEALAKPEATPPGEEERQALAQAIRTINWGANDGSLHLQGISAISSGKPVFVLGDTTWRAAIDGSKEAGPISFRLSLDALSIAENTLPTNLAPTKGALDITLDQFPVRALLGVMLEQVIDRMKSPPASEAPAAEGMPPDDANTQSTQAPNDSSVDEIAPAAGGDDATDNAAETPPSETQEPPMIGPFAADDLFLQQLFAHGTALVLNEFSIEAPGTGLKASGRFKVDPESMTMGTGKLKASLRGLDALLAYANAEARTDEEMKETAAFLIFMKGLGKAEGSGQPVYVYNIEVPKEGPPTVNGTPLDGLMGH